MSLYIFPPGDDPGPSFVDLIRRVQGVEGVPGAPEAFGGRLLGDVRHGTTIVALRYADGVVVAGDRRATEGPSIAHRAIEKVFPADRYSAVAIAGAAGPALEMVRLFQTQLEHYEKVEGSALSLEGKANQLAQLVRAHLPMAMQGLAVVPLFAGWDTRRRQGRIFTYDVTGGRYEEADYHATGSGGRDAKTTVKLGFREGLSRDEGVELAVEALFQAAVVDADGFQAVGDEEVAARFAAVLARRPAVEGGDRP